MNILLFTLIAPLVLGIAYLFAKNAPLKWLQWSAAAISLFMLLDSIIILLLGRQVFEVKTLHPIILLFNLSSYPLSALFFIFVSMFTCLVIFYSFAYFKGGTVPQNNFFAYVFMSLGAAGGVLFAADYIGLLIFWGFLGMVLYLLVLLDAPRSSEAAKKTLTIVGGTDALMILGIGFLLVSARTLNISQISMHMDNWMTICAFFCMTSAALAKAGAFPFHTWVPDVAESTNIPVIALLPASLDKILGIYLLVRIVNSINGFQNSFASLVLLVIGAATIIFAVMMALVQHNIKRLLAYHAVSQVGYMVLGIATGTFIGIAGGILHMINHTIYKSALFLGAGAVEKQTNESDLEYLGGLSRLMPITFAVMLVASLAISGVPPLNGFVSKWMIYQAIISLSKNGPLWVIWLVAAMFGSALTLASFVKLLHATFLNEPSEKMRKIYSDIKEAPYYMLVPMLILSALCFIFGIFIFVPPMSSLFVLIIGMPVALNSILIGSWAPVLATVLIIFGLLLGLCIYWLTLTAHDIKEKEIFYGGEELDTEKIRVSGTEFYYSVQKNRIMRKIYKRAENKVFDIYDISARLVGTVSSLLKILHHGLLHTYLAWCLLGLIAVLGALAASSIR